MTHSTKVVDRANTDVGAADDMPIGMSDEVDSSRLSHWQPPQRGNDTAMRTMHHAADGSLHNTRIWPRPYADRLGMADSTAANNLGHDASDISAQENSWDVFMGADAAEYGVPGDINSLDPFSGFDIPFWFEQDQHWDIL
jgi:hypothetical protein